MKLLAKYLFIVLIGFALLSSCDDNCDDHNGIIYKVADEMPRFPGCEDFEDVEDKKQCATKRMLEFIYKNINYPQEAKTARIQGGVVVSFTVTSEGDIVDPYIREGIGYGCDEECLRIVSLMSQWTPGYMGDCPVDVQYNLPVKFRLE